MNETIGKTQQIPLDRRVSFRLQRTGTLLTTQVVTLLKNAGDLTLNQWRLLSFLSERDGGSAHELAKLGHIDKATMSRAASELQKRGLIVSEVSSRDRRSAVLRVTQDGEDVVARISPMMMSRQRELVAAISEEERAALFQILEKLEAAVENSELGTV